MRKKRVHRLRLVLLGCLGLLLLIAIPHSPLRVGLDFSNLPLSRIKHPLAPQLKFLLRYFDFDQHNALKQWEEKVFSGRVKYWIDFDEQSGFVHSKSTGSASAIFYRIKFNVGEYPILSWKWRIGAFPKKQDVSDSKKRDDFAARVYVVFLERFFTNFKCIEYVWDQSLPEGTRLDSPYSDQIKQLVIQSGASPQNGWVVEERNVFEDYKLLFGGKPKLKAAAIALMTDSEGTGTEAEGFFDDIQIGKAEP